MAIVQNNYTGDGTTVLFSISFPYLDESDVVVSVNDVIVTNYIFSTASSIQFLVAPAASASIKIYRDTYIDESQATIFPGSAIKAQDLNNNFTQVLYSVQEIFARALSTLGGTLTGILNMSGFRITNLGNPSASADATNKAYVDALINAGVADGNKGDVTVSGLGTVFTVTNASNNLSVGGTGFVDLPAGTTGQRPGSPNSGMVRYNTTLGYFEGYGTDWGKIGGGATGGGSDDVFFENGQTITTSYTITTNKNAVTAGPITINTGATVTVPSGSSWSIV